MASDHKRRELRIVFMGTPDFAVAGLAALVEAGYHIVGVITAPDKPAGRGRKLQASAVKKYALSKDLKVLQPTNLKDEAFLTELRTLDPNLQVVVAFRMLPKVVWQIPAYGTFNLHASLLPQYRGAAPINWAIINGETQTGVTTFFIDEKIDTGEIILQSATPIQKEDNAGTLHDNLMELGAKLIVATVDQIKAGSVSPKKQITTTALKTAPKIYREDCQIDWSKPGAHIIYLIRGMSPYPAAWSHLKNGADEIVIKIYEAQFLQEKNELTVGTILQTKKSLRIAVKDGLIEILEAQFPGKRKMAVKDLLNGLSLTTGAHVL